MTRLAALLLFSFASLTVAAQFSPGAQDGLSSSLPLEVSKGSLEQTSISLRSPGIVIQDSTIQFENLQYFDLVGEPVFYREGYPAVPHVTRLYRIPNTGNVRLVVNNLEYTVMDNVNAVPIQKEQDRFAARIDRAPEVYERNEWYPAEPAVMGEPKIFRDFRIVELTLFPVQVNPVTGQARIYDDISVDIVSEDGIGENELLHPRRPSRIFKNVYETLIPNLDDRALDDITDTPGQLLIICRNNAEVLQWADSLATWKKRLGWDVVINSNNNWTSATVKTTIQNLYDTADPPLEFVCIVGDVGGSYGVPTHSSGYDHHYALLDGTDEYEEIGVGRLSAESLTQLNTVVNKIFYYERTPFMDDTSWYTRSFLYAGTANNVSSNEIMTIWARNQFTNFTGVTNSVLATHGGPVSNTLIGQRFNDGISYFLWRGTVVGEMDNNAATAMNPSTRLPVTLTITCGSGEFNGQTSISESFLRAGTPSAPEGGICGIGTATFNTHVPYNNTMAGGLIYGICNLNLQYLGAAVSAAKVELLRSFPFDDSGFPEAPDFTKWNNLMGDPSLSMWTRIPTVMNVSYPGTVNVGARRVRPQVTDAATGDPIADALVVLWKGDETYARSLTDAGGFVDMPVTVNTEGTMTLTVSKRNHKPFLADILCVPAAENVTVQTYELDDDNSGGSFGNDDGFLNPGEIIDFRATLHNYGNSATATNISSTMTSDNAHVTVVNASVNYPDIAPGGTVVGQNAYRIQISPLMEQDEDVKLTVTINTGSQTTFSTIELTCRAALCEFSAFSVTGGDGDTYAEPGEIVNLRVTVDNNGALPLTNVTGTLISRYSLLSVVDNSGYYGDIPVGGHVSNLTDLFQVRPNSVAYRGSQGSLLLVLTADGGHVDSVTFNLPIGQATASDPTGPDAYGYYAYDNADTAFEWTRPYEWTDIAGMGSECTNASLDPGEQLSNGVTNSDVFALPFPFMFYGETYDSITICSNGWAAFGNQADLDMFRNYPIPGSQAPDAMIAPFWEDLKTTGALGVYRYVDASNHRFIIQWNAQNTFGGNTSQIFQAILLDPVHYPTEDGNGIIVFQYNTISEHPGDNWDRNWSTIGVQAPGCLVGLQYRSSNTAAPGAMSTITSGRAITITTEASLATGIVTGVVTDFANGSPLAGVEVMVVEEAMSGMTNASGEFTINDVPIGTYTIRARLHGFNDGIASDFVVEMDSTEIVNFSMLHPEISLSTEEISVAFPGDPQETSFSIFNNGNGPLDYTMSLEYAHEGETGGEWSVINHIDISTITNDFQIQGCEFAGDYWYVTGARVASEKKIYRFDLLGNEAGWFSQPPSENDFGWFDICYDGTYLYGCAQNQHYVYGVDVNGVLRDSIPLPDNLSPARSIAYDPQSDHFWVCDIGTDIYEIDRNGETLSRFTNTLNKWGLTWNPNDPLGYKLYVFHRESDSYQTVVSRIHPVTGDVNLVRRISSVPGDRAGGCAVTSGWNSMLLVFAGVMQNPAGDRLEIRQLEFNTDWIDVTPMFSSVNPQSSRDITLVFDPTGLRDFTYHVNLLISNNSATDLVTMPITLATTLATPETPTTLPTEYALHQNYPNPFNSSTMINFDLKQPGHTTLKIYNLLGQQVLTLVDDYRDAGTHSVPLELSGVSTGIYLYRLESGNFSETKKLALIK